jgi:3-oxoacyl-[acyl-carrier protein] reductase
VELRGKCAIITGGAGGLGRRLVERLVSEEMRVTVFDRDSVGLDELRDAAPGVAGFACDATNPASVRSAVEEAVSAGGVPDLLVNNAGVIYSAPLLKFTSEGVVMHDFADWESVLAANLSSVFYVTAHVAQKMIAARVRGVIVNVSSVCAAGNPGQSAYSAAKAGVNALTATWARELGVLGIRVAGVAPGYTDTPSTHKALGEAALKEIIRRTPARRLGSADEVVEGVVAVVRNDFFNGKTLALDGGLTL